MTPRKPLVMIRKGTVTDESPCESPATATPCTFTAANSVQFPNLNGDKIFKLCVRCENAYFSIGYREPEGRSIPSQSHRSRRITDDESTSISEYNRRERNGY